MRKAREGREVCRRFACAECDEEDFVVVVVGVRGWLAGLFVGCRSCHFLQRHGSDGNEINFLVCTMAVEAMR